ncbi:MAG: rod shape-determining protein MreC [Burkholderiaceae bacterium]|nr:rod shape-determining protein MreC [Burkholderiaceae bacterium]
MEYSPPPFFKQGLSANARLAFFALLAIALLVIDARTSMLTTIRQGIGAALYPLQRTVLVPRDTTRILGDYFGGISRLRDERAELARIEAANARTLLQVEQLAAENNQLRRTLEMRERLAIRSVVGEVLYETRDPFTHRVVLDRGLQHGIALGQPVIDATGVIGQVTLVLPLSSEVTLISDRSTTLPVELARSGQRAISFGGPDPGHLELRYLPTNSDVVAGDLVVTSGLDGVFPPGLPVGRVESFQREGGGSFASATMTPLAGVHSSHLLLVLLTERANVPANTATKNPPAIPRSRARLAK